MSPFCRCRVLYSTLLVREAEQVEIDTGYKPVGCSRLFNLLLGFKVYRFTRISCWYLPHTESRSPVNGLAGTTIKLVVSATVCPC